MSILGLQKKKKIDDLKGCKSFVFDFGLKIDPNEHSVTGQHFPSFVIHLTYKIFIGTALCNPSTSLPQTVAPT